MELSEIQRWLIIPKLKQAPGISDVVNFGGLTKEFQLTLDPLKMRVYNLSLNDISSAINNNTTFAGGGRVTRGEQSYIIRGRGQVHTLDELGAIVVKQHNGVPVLIRDLGKLEFGHKEREGILGKIIIPIRLKGLSSCVRGECGKNIGRSTCQIRCIARATEDHGSGHCSLS